MEDVYQTFSGWEQLAETCRAFCGVWELEGSEEEYETARGWVKWVRVNFVGSSFAFPTSSLLVTASDDSSFASLADWVGLRRNYISTFLPGGLPHSIGELEALDLRPNLLELVSIPPYVDPLGGRTVTPESLMKAVQRIGMCFLPLPLSLSFPPTGTDQDSHFVLSLFLPASFLPSSGPLRSSTS